MCVCVLRFLVSLLYIFSVVFCSFLSHYGEQAVREPTQLCPAPVTLTFDLLTLEVVSESRVTCMVYTSMPILVFLGLSVLDLGPMYATDRQTSDSIIA